MKLLKIAVSLIIGITLSATSYAQQNSLTAKILSLDSLFFSAYNQCDTVTQRELYADGIQFFHDKNGLTESKDEIMASTIKYICGKVERELVPGSVEIYPIKDYGAIEIGLHRFINKAEDGEVSPNYKFIIFWKNNNGKWVMEKIVSLHI